MPELQITTAIRTVQRLLERGVSHSFDVLSPQNVQHPHLPLFKERREEGDGHCGIRPRVGDRKPGGVSRGELCQMNPRIVDGPLPSDSLR